MQDDFFLLSPFECKSLNPYSLKDIHERSGIQPALVETSQLLPLVRICDGFFGLAF